jgi:hypothetical protein
MTNWNNCAADHSSNLMTVNDPFHELADRSVMSIAVLDKTVL